jgi:multiple sugar transport system ATP-binding protein
MGQLTLKNVRKSFGAAEVIRAVDLDVSEGEFVVFVGPSGCGKSTLLRMVAGLEDTTSGDIIIGGRRVNNLPPVKRGIAMVFQSYALYPHMTVFENIAFPLRVERLKEPEVQAKVHAAARILQLEERLQHKPGELSGGQRQRVAIGRAIVREPKIFLFDEPLSNLDAALRSEMRVELTRLHKKLGSTMIYVTHDQVEAMTMADRIVVLNAGVVQQVGTPIDLYHRPANRFVAGFIGSPKMNFMQARMVARDATSAKIEAPYFGEIVLTVAVPDAAAGDTVTLGIRPEAIALGAGRFTATLKPSIIERLGLHTVVYSPVEGREELFTALLSGDPAIAEGEAITVAIDPEGCHLFDRDGHAFPRLG